MTIQLLQGDCRAVLATLPERSVQTCVTSPPYWQQRRYTNSPDELGQEPTYQQYVMALSDVFDEVWRVLRDDGTAWVNIGDAYANDTKWGGASGNKNYTSAGGGYGGQRNKRTTGLPPKSLIGLPWRVAFALQERGWVLRTDIVWEKPNGMPEKVVDRPTRTHEYIFLLTKQPHYFCDMEALREASAPSSQARAKYNNGTPSPKAIAGAEAGIYCGPPSTAKAYGQGRNLRTVWSIATQALRDDHYAPYPEELARRCILAGSRPGDTVLDPFVGSGTLCRVAERYGRDSIGIDLGYQDLQEQRTDGVQISMEAYL